MRRFSLAALLLLAGVLPAGAHPHVWIDAIVTFAFQDGRIVAIRQEWTFDEVFGDAIIGQFDLNKDKKFDAKELAALQLGAFANLREFDYFTHLSSDDKAVPTKAVTGFAARVEKGQAGLQLHLAGRAGRRPAERARVAGGVRLQLLRRRADRRSRRGEVRGHRRDGLPHRSRGKYAQADLWWPDLPAGDVPERARAP
jgi:hypothetical protein